MSPRRAPPFLAALLLLSATVFLSAPTHASTDASTQSAVRDAVGPTGSGRDMYVRHCARCHQSDGHGVEGLYPSLRELKADGADREAMIRGVLEGRRGTLELGSARFDDLMPIHGYLGNEIIAGALSYVLTQWGSTAVPVTDEEVAAVRMSLLSDHPRPADPAAGTSPLAEMDAVQYVTTGGPPMTVEEFERARRLYYGRCTACHGVLRLGTAGNPLTPGLMRERGTEYLQSVISHGASSGMPGWGTSADLSGPDINLLARFLQHPVPQPPDLNEHQIRDGWHQHRIPSERPRQPRHDYDTDAMFVVTLHDVGEIALLDGAGKSMIGRVPVCRAPHRVAANADGRFLYVICRDGTLAMVDLHASPPERVASVRIGYEARTVAVAWDPATGNDLVLAGAYWPPQLVLLDGRTLEPLRVLSTRSYYGDTGRYHPEPRVSDIAASPFHGEFISQLKETGHVYLFPYSAPGGVLQIRDLETVPELRSGSFSADHRYYLTPADSNVVSVLDVRERSIVAEIPERVFGGNPGTSYVDDVLGPVWLTSTMVGDELIVVGTDPEGHPENAWRVLQRIRGPASGSLFLASHPQSEHLWMDTPLNADAEHSRSVAVFTKGRLRESYRTLPVAEWSGLSTGPRRVLQPAYSADGREVWLAVWNPQDQPSAVVVVDDRTLEPIASIRRPELITATRIYSVAALRAAAGEADSAPASASED